MNKKVFPGFGDKNSNFSNTKKIPIIEEDPLPIKSESRLTRLCCTSVQNIGIPGIPNLFNSSGPIFSIFWMLANIICWTGFIIVMVLLSLEYVSFETNVDLDIKTSPNLNFPAVSICNLNRVKANMVANNSYYKDLTSLSQSVTAGLYKKANSKLNMGMTFNVANCNGNGLTQCSDNSYCYNENEACDGENDCDNGEDEKNCQNKTESDYQNVGDKEGFLNANMLTKINWDDPNWFKAYETSTTEDYRDLYPMTLMQLSQVKEWGSQENGFIISCSFDQNTCNTTTDFLKWQDERFGNCFTFNSKYYDYDLEGIKKNTGRTGVLYGLKVNLFLDIDNYIGLISPKVGALVAIHNPDVEPMMATNGIVVEPGKYTEIGVKNIKITRLSGNYGDCISSYPTTLKLIPERKKYTYNQQVCLSYCLQQHLYDDCNCVDTYMADIDNLCNFKNVTVTDCVHKVHNKFAGGTKSCPECTSACEDDFYETSESSTKWPSDGAIPFFIDYMWKNLDEDNEAMLWLTNTMSEKTMDLELVAEKVRTNFLRLSVHFETMNYETIKFNPSYQIYQYIADIGGYMGLFVGVCAISIFEVTELIMKTVMLPFTKM